MCLATLCSIGTRTGLGLVYNKTTHINQTAYLGQIRVLVIYCFYRPSGSYDTTMLNNISTASISSSET